MSLSSTFQSCGPEQDNVQLQPTEPRSVHSTAFVGSFEPFASGAIYSPTQRALMRALLMFGGIRTKLLTPVQNIIAVMWRPFTLICTVFVAAYDCYICILHATGTSVVKLPLMVDYIIYAASHVTKGFGLFYLCKMHKTVAVVSESSESSESCSSTGETAQQRHQIVHLLSPRESSMLVGVAPVLLCSTIMASIADYRAGNYQTGPGTFVVGPCVATLLTVGYSVSNVSFACCLVLIVAAVERARRYVEQAAADVKNWRFPRQKYMWLVERLRSHCSFVRTPIVMCFASLCLSSLGSGIDIWYVGQGDQKKDVQIMLTVTQCINFSCWALLMLTLLWDFASVRKEIGRCFIAKVKEDLKNARDDSALQNDLQSSLDLMINIEPAGWFLTNSWYVGESLFKFSLVLSVLNGGAKLFDMLKKYV